MRVPGTFLVFLLAAPPWPAPPASAEESVAALASQNGDVNGNGTIDLSDAIYLLNWQFLGGPGPVGLEDCVDPAGDEVDVVGPAPPPDKPPPDDDHFLYGAVGLARGQVARLSVSFAAPPGGCPVGGIQPCSLVGFVNAAGEPITDRAGNIVQSHFELAPGETRWLDLDAREVLGDELRAQVRGVVSFEDAAPDGGDTDPCPGLVSTLEVLAILGGRTEVLHEVPPLEGSPPPDDGRFLFGSVGVARGEVARLAVSFATPLGGCPVGGIQPCTIVGFVDAAGEPITDHAGNIVQGRFELRPGETRWLDLVAEDFLGDRELRRQIRAVVSVDVPSSDGTAAPCGALVPTLEVFARKTGRTEVLSANPRFEPDRPVTIAFPSPDFATIQAAIDFLRDGGVLRIAPGTYALEERLLVAGKRITIAGAGSSVRAGERATRLVAPIPRRVVPAGEARGCITYIDGGGEVRDLDLVGLDAGIARFPDLDRPRDPARSPVPLRVERVLMSENGRGILALSPDPMTVDDCEITDSIWNGISINPVFFGPFQGLSPAFEILGTIIGSTGNIGILVVDNASTGNCEGLLIHIIDTDVGLCTGGGIVALRSGVCIRQNNIWGNRIVGVGLLDSASVIDRSLITSTFPRLSDGLFGDGVLVAKVDFSSIAWLDDVDILHSSRAGISNFGAFASLGDTRIRCAAFDLEGEAFNGSSFLFEDRGGNVCGCPVANQDCEAVSAGFVPPDPVAPLE